MPKQIRIGLDWVAKPILIGWMKWPGVTERTCLGLDKVAKPTLMSPYGRDAVAKPIGRGMDGVAKPIVMGWLDGQADSYRTGWGGQADLYWAG